MERVGAGLTHAHRPDVQPLLHLLIRHRPVPFLVLPSRRMVQARGRNPSGLASGLSGPDKRRGHAADGSSADKRFPLFWLVGSNLGLTAGAGVASAWRGEGGE